MKFIENHGTLLLAVKVVPNSSRTAVAGWLGDALKLKMAQPAEGGKANRAVVALLAEVLGIPEAQVAIVSGLTQARKVVRILGITRQKAAEKLGRSTA